MGTIFCYNRKVIFGETLDVILILNNTVDTEIRIKELKIKISNATLEHYESFYKKVDQLIFSNTNVIIIEPNKFYSQKIRFPAEIVCRYK